MNCVVALFAVLAVASAVSETVTPVQKVLQMMDDMLAKGKKAKAEEQVAFSTYKQFCQSTSAEKTRDIEDGKAAIIQLKADIEKASADAMTLASEIGTLTSDIDELSSQQAEAKAIRAKEKADFMAIHAEYTSAIDAVDRALQVLATSPTSFAQIKDSLTSLQSFGRVSSKAKAAIMSFLQGDHDPAEVLLQQTPKTYESSSGGIIDMVKELGKKFKEEKYVIETEEAKKKHASDMIVQDLQGSLDRSSKESSEKMATKSQREKDKSEAEGDLADTTAAVASDTTYLADLTKECSTKAADYEARQVVRAGEVQALMKAIEIMSGSAVGGGTQHLPSLVQKTSFVQLRSAGQSPLQQQVATFLKDRAHKANSKILSFIATRVAEDPFKKIKKMIQDMVDKLMTEANEEAEHKGFCDTEMGTNKNTRDTKTEEVEKLTALIEELTADIAKLGTDAATLAGEIAELDAAVSKATAIRTEESAKNTATVADAKAASLATASALQVLKEFYGANEGTVAQGSSSTGIVGMLEVISSDFIRLETETTAAEDKAATEYTAFMRDSSQDKAVKTTDMKHKTNTKTAKEGDLEEAKKDLKGTQEELDAALAYFEKLKPSCVEAGESYEERKARREEEIESLKDALQILEETQ
jgi:DNA repair exonuclease SbcCD ATPase subunit